MKFNSISFVAADQPKAQEALNQLRERYGSVPPDQASIIVALGGDGLMLETLHKFMKLQTPIYGMNRGSVGFLMNKYIEGDLFDRLENAVSTKLHPL